MSDSHLTLEKISIEEFRLYSLTALKSFLSIRKKSTTGSIDTLIARAFAAAEENIPIDPELEHQERANTEEYTKKFTTLSVDDPFSIPHNEWLDEKDAIHKWPKTYFMDISRYFSQVLGNDNLWQRLECEYKEGKAYRYYSDGFLGELQITFPKQNPNVCVMRCKCLPSQRVSMKQYDVWAIIQQKDTDNEIDGQILRGYCTCTAGLLGSCNHVAGLLFRLEIANLLGETRKTCTSVRSKYMEPSSSKKKTIKPGKLSSFVFRQDNYSKLAISKTKEDSKKILKRKLEYMPMSSSITNTQLVSNPKKMRKMFFDSFKDVDPDSCFIQMMEGKPIIVNKEETQNSEILSLKEHAKIFKDNNCYDHEKYLQAISLTDDQITKIYEKTVSQSNSKFWFEQRKGRITASNFKKIYTRMESLKTSDEDPIPLLKDVMGESSRRATWSMKHGISSERHAIMRLKQVIRLKHRGIKFTNPGMTVSKEYPYISATPDLEFECPCCGKGVCEVKCPTSVPLTRAPSWRTYGKHLENRNGSKLKTTSPYYFQIQGQMAVTNRYFGYFLFSTLQTEVFI
ncbi:uncharacterized protein [Clytia hemisphaerica]|uniref:uncharacterized protein n=1 Tax=Clytia hemisphaerica TaxID=252671 RepID=UPI0034D53B8D